MTAVGIWEVTLSTPMGPQIMQLHIHTQDDSFTGRIQSPLGDMDIAGAASGDTLSWVMNVKKPMPIKVTVNATVDGDSMSGTAKLGMFGQAALSGKRLAPSTPGTAGPTST